MYYFTSLLEEYVMNEVIQTEWLRFKKALTSISLFEELVDLHNGYLNTILEKCFLRGTVRDGNTEVYVMHERKLQQTFNLIFNHVFKLNHLIREYGTSICESDALTDLESVAQQFKETSTALYAAVRNMAYKGQHQELFLKMDFNRYFAKQRQI
jgi:hypothetical protein